MSGETRPRADGFGYTAHAPIRQWGASFASFCCSVEVPRGPTSLLAQLGRRGHAVVKGSGPRIVKEEQNSDRPAFPSGSDKTAGWPDPAGPHTLRP
jgi:hypothetical protein